MLAHMQHRPGLFTGAVVAVVIGFAASQFVPELSAALVGWCAGVLVYVCIDIVVAARATVRTMQARAEAVGETRLTVLLISVTAAIASLAAIVINFAQAKNTPHIGFATSLAAVTVVLSWVFVHTVFAFTYAHDFYRGCKGLTFPNTPTPDYWDFAYFAFVIGATAQVSDVAITSSSIRRLALAHGIISFFFNTAILAFGVNLAASLVT
jgi:uncharacterized membrane protein